MEVIVGKNVFNMDREELMDYLYEYITLRNTKVSFESNKAKKLNEINRNKERKIIQLNDTDCRQSIDKFRYFVFF